MKSSHRVRDVILDYLLLTFATWIVASAVFLFMMPSHATISSITGIAMVLQFVIPLTVAQITFLLNCILITIGFFVFGREFGAKTVYTSLMMPVIMRIYEIALPDFKSLTGDPLTDVLAYVVLVSLGLSILFNDNACSGGIDIVAKLLNKYFHINIGTAMTVAGVVVSFSSGLVYDAKTVVLSLLGTYLNGIILDRFIFGATGKKRVCIVSQKEEEICDFILKTLHSGASLYDCIGAYTLEPHREIITIVDRHEYQKLMDYIVKTDPDAFVTIYSVENARYLPKAIRNAEEEDQL
ncbi:MAG: YitT family protein [Eubacterium sp.]|jgi:uncharacterized membrane-anchored protein YitT (DUF2179 family)